MTQYTIKFFKGSELLAELSIFAKNKQQFAFTYVIDEIFKVTGATYADVYDCNNVFIYRTSNT